MTFNFLRIENKSVYLLGYKLKLSPTETKLLTEIAKNDGMTIDALLPLLSDGVSRGNIAVHINSINKKAESISERKLVLFDGEKYVINRYM